MNIFLLMLTGVLGIFVSVLARVRNARKTSTNLPINVTFHTFLNDEWLNLIISLIGVIIAGFLIDSKVTEYITGKFQGWTGLVLKCLFLTIGYSGSDLILKYFSVTQKLINKEVDKMAAKVNDNTPNT